MIEIPGALKANGEFALSEQAPMAHLHAASLLATDTRTINALQQQLAEYKQTIENLRRREARYRRLLEGQHDPICCFQADFTLTFINQAYSAVYGEAPATLLGRNVLALIPPEYRSSVVAHLASLTPANPVALIENPVHTANGTIRWFQWINQLILDEHGRLVEYQAIGRDITERRAAEAAERNQRQRAEALCNSLAALTGTLSVEAVMQQILESVATVVPSEAGCIILFAEGEGRIAYTRGYTPEAATYYKQYRFTRDSEMAERIFGHKSYLIPDTKSWPDWVPLAFGEWIHSSIGVPIALREQTIGLLVLDSATPNHFEAADVDKLQAFAQYAGLALENAYHVYHLEERVAARSAEVAEERNLLRTVLDTIPDAIYVKDREHRFLLCNHTPVSSKQPTDPQLYLGKTDFDFHPPEVAERFLAEEQAIFNTGQPILRQEMTLTRADGSVVWLLTTKLPLRNQQGEIIGLAGISNDITALKLATNALAASEEKFRQLVETMGSGMAVYDLDNRITYVNERFCSMLGYTREELIGTLAAAYVDMNGLTKLDHELAKRLQGISSVYELMVLCKGGHYCHWLVSGSPLRNEQGQVIGSFAVVTDISLHKKAEQALEEALRKEKELSELKSRFVTTASHEFRTPLTSILMMTDTLLTYRHKLTPDQFEQRLLAIREQGQYLKTLMEDVLELASIQAGRAKFEPVVIDLSLLCGMIIDELQPQAEASPSLRYECIGPIPLAHLDRRLMRQVITNLVTNALKYSLPLAEVLVRLTCAGDSLVLQVVDHGIGIPDTDLPYLFQPFHRATNVGVIQGTGLGLVITKEAVELHGGRIIVTSQLGVGTTFTVTIPIHRLDSATQPDPA